MSACADRVGKYVNRSLLTSSALCVGEQAEEDAWSVHRAAGRRLHNAFHSSLYWGDTLRSENGKPRSAPAGAVRLQRGLPRHPWTCISGGHCCEIRSHAQRERLCQHSRHASSRIPLPW